jgi:uncharacterized protein YecA (UPF0149 family)
MAEGMMWSLEHRPLEEEDAELAAMVAWLCSRPKPVADHLAELVNEEMQKEVSRHGRNEPCVCGSGAKFKKCCLPVLSLRRRFQS